MTDTTYYASPETDTKTAAKKVYEIIRNQQMRLYSDRGIANVWNRNLEIYFKNTISLDNLLKYLRKKRIN